MKAQSKNQTRRELRRLRSLERQWERLLQNADSHVEYWRRRALKSGCESRAQAETIKRLMLELRAARSGLQGIPVARIEPVSLDVPPLIVPVRFG